MDDPNIGGAIFYGLILAGGLVGLGVYAGGRRIGKSIDALRKFIEDRQR